jgi:acyl-coenzyme A synthetase/AMP-(fatty) acid ligase
MANLNTQFFISEKDNLIITYDELISKINSLDSVPNVVHLKNTHDFYLNITAAIAYNLDIILSDSTDEEKNVLFQKVVKKHNITSDFFLEKILTSTATISLYTSGTTGQPKLITHSVKNFIRSTKVSIKHAPDIWLMAYNPTHMAGLQVFFQAVTNFNKIIYGFQYGKEEVIALLNKYLVTNISATPTFYRLLFPINNTFPFVRNITLGGEKSDELLYQKIKHAFPLARITNIYASTEAGSLFYSDGNVFVIKKDMEPFVKVADNKLFIAKSIMGKTIDLKEDVDIKWYDTGDIVQVIEENPLSIRFISRSNEMINIGGNKINPGEVEECLLEIDGIRNAVVYGKINSVTGNILVAEIELENKESNLDNLAIRKILSEKLLNYKIPRIIKFTDSISVTRTGKIKRTS